MNTCLYFTARRMFLLVSPRLAPSTFTIGSRLNPSFSSLALVERFVWDRLERRAPRTKGQFSVLQRIYKAQPIKQNPSRSLVETGFTYLHTGPKYSCTNPVLELLLVNKNQVDPVAEQKRCIIVCLSPSLRA